MTSMFKDCFRAILRSSTSTSEIARKAGISRNTLYSWLRGDNEPRLETLKEALLTIGYSPVIQVQVLSDGYAASAARLISGDPRIRPTDETQEWVERFKRWQIKDEDELLDAAHKASNPLARAGSVHFLSAQPLRLASAADATGQRWALSEGSHGSIIWCEDPAAVAELLPERIRRSPEPVHCGASLVQSVDSELEGREKVEGIYRVAKLQQAIDWRGNA